jgi:hypothetical protein
MSGSEPNAPTPRAARADLVAVALVLAVAGVAASFVARNSDLWLHLATGRLLAHGEYRFGTDPFAGAEPYWANHAWLWDLGAYGAFGAFGGSALVALKALAVVLTAALMFAACRPRVPLWVCSACVLLGVLAMAPRLLLQPAVASYLLLAGCLACLSSGRAIRAVPVLIAVWVNLDSWFVLGPVLVVLFALDRERRATWPKWFVPAALLAWLANPHHAFALQLPMEVSAWGGELATDPRFAALFAHPWRWVLFESGSPAAWAHALLLALGAASFVANPAARRSWRAPVWLAFAALGAWQARLVPFFAVVGAPVLASNVCEVWPARALARPGRLLVVLGSAALLALGWFGGLTGPQARDRGAAWAVHSEPGLERAALNLKEWRAAHPKASALVTHPDLAHYLAWHAPEVGGFVDSRFQLFAPRAAEYLAHSRALGLVPGDSAFTPRAPDAVALYDPDGGRMANALAVPSWKLHRVIGSAALLVPEPFADAGFDAERAAFGGATDLPVAGESEPAIGVEAGPWRRETGRGGSWPADSAGVHLRAGDSGALALLAVRAARAGTEADPRDPIAWLHLGRAYLAVGSRGHERADGAGFAPLGQLRAAQATGALARAAALNPDLAAAHDALAQLYAGRHALDSALAHAREVARLVRRTGRGPLESADEYARRVARAEGAADALEARVFEAENRLLVRTGERGGDPLGRARAAVELGLAQKALDGLLAAPPDLYGTDGLRLLADSLLRTGRVAECRALLDRPELVRNTDALGFYELPRRGRAPYRFAAYDWLDACQRAAAGHYAPARAALDRLIARAGAEGRAVRPALERGGAALFAGEVGAAVPPRPVVARLALAPDLLALSDYLGRAIELGAVAGDLHTVAGALELERGNTAGAGARFRAALELYAPVRDAGLPVPGAPLAARYLSELRR